MSGIGSLLEEAGIAKRVRSEVESILEEREQEYLDSAVASLPERQKMVFALRYYESLRNAEIATILGAREAQVEELFEKATHALCRKLARNGTGRRTNAATGRGIEG